MRGEQGAFYRRHDVVQFEGSDLAPCTVGQQRFSHPRSTGVRRRGCLNRIFGSQVRGGSACDRRHDQRASRRECPRARVRRVTSGPAANHRRSFGAGDAEGSPCVLHALYPGDDYGVINQGTLTPADLWPKLLITSAAASGLKRAVYL